MVGFVHPCQSLATSPAMNFKLPLRLGLTAKTVMAASMVAVVVIAVTFWTNRTFERLHSALDVMSGTGLEQLMTSVRLVQQTESLVSLGLILAQAQSHDERRRALLEFNDRAQWMRKLSTELTRMAADGEVITRVNQRQLDLMQNIEALNALVRDRLDSVTLPGLAEDIASRSARNQALAGELSVMMGYFSAAQRSQLAEQSTMLATEVRNHQKSLIVLTAFLLLSVLLSSIYFERQLVRRILRLQRAVANPKVSLAELHLDGADELTQLSTTVGSYVQRIQEHEALMQHANEELAFLAEHDPLTQLANRRHFDAAAHRLLLHSPLPLCVVICDIDHFKRVNDAYGHALGDQALVHIAKQLQSCMRANDVLARFGGEEFAAVLPVRSQLEAHEVVGRMKQRVAGQPLHTDDIQALELTLSYGVALIEDLPLDPGTDLKYGQVLLNLALRAADDALYEAKRTGRNRICFAAGTLHAHVLKSQTPS